MALRSSRGALLRKVLPLTIHGQPCVEVHYSPAGEEDRVYRARLGTEAVYDGIAEGHQAVVHSLMNVVTRIEKA